MPPKRYFDNRGSASASKTENDDSLADIAMEDIGEDFTLKEQSSSKIPQRKKKETGPHIQTTLFISSLPFTATSTDLTTLFSDIGPLRRAFIVTEKETGKSKGVGYVTFAIHEDAKRAFEQMQGHSLDGKRKMRIEWATGRFGVGHSDHDLDASNETASPAWPIVSLLRIINRFTNVHVRLGDVENVVYPAPSSIVASELSNDVAHVIYRTPNHAMTAVTKLHAHTFKGAQVSVVLKKRADGAARLDAHMRPDTKAKRDALRKKVEEEQEKVRLSKGVAREHDLKPEINRGSRLIVRNLPFDVTDRDLRAVFLPFGPIYSIDVPQKVAPSKKEEEAALDVSNQADDEEMVEEAEKTTNQAEEMEAEPNLTNDASSVSVKNPTLQKQGRGRGFAFVWHVSRNDAVNAIKGLNGTEIGHGAAEKAQVKAAKGKAGRDAAKKAFETVMQNAQPPRQVAVDWALSKKEWEQKKDESEAGDTDVEAVDDDEEGEEEGDSEPLEIDEDENDEENEGESKPSLPRPEEGTTLFIRNLPYQATEEELRNLFRSFGPLRYAKLTMDNVSKRPKGTAFVCFWQKESAEKALQQAHLVEQEASAGTSSHSAKAAKKANPFSASSILTADPSAPLTSQLSLHGRVLSVVEAVERTEANALATASQSAREKSDKRNTYLMREGVPMPETPLASKLSEVEIDRRLSNFQMRKVQMIKNPSLFISKTRLSVRQLPLFVTDKVLKRLAEFAVKRFDEQVEAGEREDLTTEEIQESRRLAKEMQRSEDAADAREQRNDGDDENEEDKTSASKKQQLRLKRKSALQRRRMTNKGGYVVAQSKVIRAKDRLDATTGIGRSHGYGFVEMVTFADALKFVRFANANGNLRKDMLSWYAEELGGMLTKLQKDRDPSKITKEDDEWVARKRRIEKKKAQLEAGHVDVEEEGTRGGLLVVEFSIENVVTVKRRSERNRDKIRSGRDRQSRGENGDHSKGNHMQNARTRLGKRSRNDESSSSAGGRSEERANKKPRKPPTWNQKTKKGVSKQQPFVVPTTTDNGYADRSQRVKSNGAENAEKSTTKKGSIVGSIIGRKRKMKSGKK
ncbi:hypothetical protein IEQ34_026216 [Dendrobium chrysotoxum]|uniref:RRM domain-containing protein n=1 Tax=Dendrobium chrysotoxum TaxID=161865 RepID=A0AAV7FMF5_DENCH|nr:hypothetical protein IEQ34_026216 [Dendrobium chrysotoxum]